MYLQAYLLVALRIALYVQFNFILSIYRGAEDS